MDINKNPNLLVGDVFMHVSVSQKERRYGFLLSCVA